MRAFAITESLDAFLEANPSLRSLGVERWAPVPGEDAYAGGVRPLAGFRDPCRGRAMTYGELGCFAAHFSLWERCVAEGSKSVLVLEGDVLVEEDGVERARKIAEGFDVVYLAHKKIANDAAFWTCAYLVNADALRALQAECRKMGQRAAAPADEVLIAACRSLRVAYMDPPGASPRPDSMATSATEKSRVVETLEPCMFAGHRVVALTYATDPEHGYHRMLMETASLYGLYVKPLGYGKRWDGGDVASGLGGARKLLDVFQELSNGDLYSDDDIVIFVDGYDVLINGPVERCMASEIAQNKVILARDSECWPDPGLKERYEGRGEFEGYVNSGCYAGLRKNVLSFLRRCLERVRGPADDDQLAMSLEYLEDAGRSAIVDSFGVMFFTMNGRKKDADYATPGPWLEVLPTSHRPFAVHFNGPGSVKAAMPEMYTRHFVTPGHGVVFKDPEPEDTERSGPDVKLAIFHEGGPGNTEVPGMRVVASACLRSVDVAKIAEASRADIAIALNASATPDEIRSLALALLGSGKRAVCHSKTAEPGLPVPVSEPSGTFAALASDVASGRIDLINVRTSAARSGVVIYGIRCRDRPAPVPLHSKFPEMYALEVFPKVFSVKSFLTPEFCGWLVDRCEASGRWSSGTDHLDSRTESGYENVPTRDVRLADLGPEVAEAWNKIFLACRRVAAELFDSYELSAASMAFVIKYEASNAETCFLRPHHDSSAVTLNVALNRNYEGGGTWFKGLGVVEARETGEALIHPGRPTHRHGALRVTSGTRYVLVAFME